MTLIAILIGTMAAGFGSVWLAALLSFGMLVRYTQLSSAASQTLPMPAAIVPIKIAIKVIAAYARIDLAIAQNAQKNPRGNQSGRPQITKPRTRHACLGPGLY